jgi:RNA polymerase sigma factor (sigma-70 family)
MSETELISGCIKNDKTAKKQFFDAFCGKLGYIALRYSKNEEQSEELLVNSFNHLFSNLQNFKSKQEGGLDGFVKNQFIRYAVQYIKSIRNEYYVASTVKAIENRDRTYDLFLDNKYVDVKNINEKLLLKSIQALVPSHRLLFNLHVIDNYTLAETSEMLDTSEQSIKSNLEKARYNLQKLIETNLKNNSDEQPV